MVTYWTFFVYFYWLHHEDISILFRNFCCGSYLSQVSKKKKKRVLQNMNKKGQDDIFVHDFS